MEEINVRYVAIYLRKSRGDDETALDKHKLVLTELCVEKNWKYVLYEEIMSGDSIAMRPIFTQLLNDIENGIYDGVVVMDIDRLGRGNQSDQGKINQAFAISNTFIITPQQIFNLNNEDDEFVVDMKSFISRREYKQIVKRLSQGKKIGSRQGNWTNGIPPYGYSYERYGDKFNSKGLVVNDEQFKIYRMIIDSITINYMSPKEIAVMLNKMNIPSPRNSYWHGNTIHRLVVDETHLGKIISNKTKGDGHVNKKPNSKNIEIIPKDQWVIVNNCHEAIKSQEEHDKIISFLARLTKSPRRTQQQILPLSSLIKCGKCGHTMGVYKRGDRNFQHTLKPCWYTDSYGNKCGNSGIELSYLYSFIKIDAQRYLNDLNKQLKESNFDDGKLNLEQQILLLQSDLQTKQKSLARILDAFESGLYSLEQFKERKMKIDDNINQLETQISMLENEYNKFDENSILEKIDNIENFLNNFDNIEMPDEQKNRLFKKTIDHIKWTRNKDDIQIDIKYL